VVTRAEAEAQARALFSMLDANRDGGLTRAEVAALPVGNAITPQEFALLDRNHDGVISAAECAEFADQQFTLMDGDGDGRLSLAEVQVAQRVR
jgi:Ca2+-binding EF-hand superfamily protein